MSLRKFIASFALFLFAAGAHAGIEKGDRTLSIFGALQFDEFSDTLILQATAGQFMTDTLELQGVVQLISSEDDFGNVTSVNGYGVNANLYMPGNNPDFIPYIGGGGILLLTDFNGTTDTTLGLNGQVGIKQFLNETISINYQAQILTSSDYDSTILSVGFTIFLE